MTGYDAVVLAGGSSRRMADLGPRHDKTGFDVGGRTLLQIALAAVCSAQTIIVVGPKAEPDTAATRVIWTSEEPPGGGPVAAIEAGLGHVTASKVVVLAADLPFVRPLTIDALIAASVDFAGAIAIDDEGRDQPLLAVYAASALRTALPEATSGARLRDVLTALEAAAELTRVAIPGHPPAWWDCDSPEALTQARMWS